MRGAALSLLVVLWASGPAVAQGPADRLDDPRPGRRGREAPEGPAEEASHDDVPAPRPWTGPQIQLGYSTHRLADGYGGGRSHVGGLGVFLRLPVPAFRGGAWVEFGSRGYSLGGDDLTIRGELEAGYQLVARLGPVVPYLTAVGTLGTVVAERFESTQSYVLGGGGVRLGADVQLVRNLHLGASIAYLRVQMDGASFNLFVVRLVAGL